MAGVGQATSEEGSQDVVVVETPRVDRVACFPTDIEDEKLPIVVVRK